MDLSAPVGEKWASRTLPPPPTGDINERVAIGGDCRQKKRKVRLELVQVKKEGTCTCVCVCMSMFGGGEGCEGAAREKRERVFVFNCNWGCCTSTKVHHYLPDSAPQSQALPNKYSLLKTRI